MWPVDGDRNAHISRESVYIPVRINYSYSLSMQPRSAGYYIQDRGHKIWEPGHSQPVRLGSQASSVCYIKHWSVCMECHGDSLE